MSARVILADDHRVFLDGLSRLLEESGVEVVARTTNRDELPELIRRLRPDVAVVDVSMGGLSIPELLVALRDQDKSPAVLVLTGNSPYAIAEDLLAAGARGFMLKDNTFDSILEAIQTISSGGTYVSAEVAAELLAFRTNAPGTLALTDRQREILRLVAAGDTSKSIARTLGIHIKTVDHHRHHIREKLGARSSAEMVRLAQERGLF